MTEREFFYWLQGYFELTSCLVGKERDISDENFVDEFYDCILAHIEICRKHAQPSILLRDKILEIAFLCKYRMSPVKIQEVIHSAFQHVVDSQDDDTAENNNLRNTVWMHPKGMKC
jgi:hypothetical protein